MSSSLEFEAASIEWSKELGEHFQDSPYWWVDWPKNGMVISLLDTGYEQALPKIAPVIFPSMVLAKLPECVYKDVPYCLEITNACGFWFFRYRSLKGLILGIPGAGIFKYKKLTDAACAMFSWCVSQSKEGYTKDTKDTKVKHWGDCSIYKALENCAPNDGCCDCGEGRKYFTDYPEAQYVPGVYYSKQRLNAGLNVREK